jgi:hypothetical protein
VEEVRMKKLLAITTFVIVTASYIFTVAWANEYTDVYIRPVGEVEVGDQAVASHVVETEDASFYTSAKEVSPQPVTKYGIFDKGIKLLPDRAGLLNSNGLKLFGDERDKTGIDGNELSRIKVVTPEYKANSVTVGDILRSIPVLSIKDEQTLGVIIPPFAYFAKKF